MNEQIKDQGAVIGYSPNLSYEKERHAKLAPSTEYPTESGVKRSSTLSAFFENTPAQLLKEMRDSKQRMQDAIERLKTLFSNEVSEATFSDIELFLGTYEEDGYSKEFLSYHKNNIEGSSIPELIDQLVTEQQTLITLEETLKKLYYGDASISLEKAEVLDKEYASVLAKKEADQEAYAINYLTIASDTTLNCGTKAYLYQLNAGIIDLESVIYEANRSEFFEVAGDTGSLLTTLFHDVNEDLVEGQRARANANIDETIKQSLYYYYQKRSELNQLYHISHLTNDTYLNNKVSEYEEKLATAIENVNRSLFLNTSYLSNIRTKEEEKQRLRSIFQRISNKV